MIVQVRHRNKRILIDVRTLSFMGRFFGLMFRTRKTTSLLFTFGKRTHLSIHSFFVFFPFLALWLDEKNQVIDYKMVYPFSIREKPKIPFYSLIEVPLEDKNKGIIDFFVGKRKI